MCRYGVFAPRRLKGQTETKAQARPLITRQASVLRRIVFAELKVNAQNDVGWFWKQGSPGVRWRSRTVCATSLGTFTSSAAIDVAADAGACARTAPLPVLSLLHLIRG